MKHVATVEAILPRNRYSQTRRLRDLKVIAECGDHLTRASDRLGISIATLSKWWREERMPTESATMKGTGFL